MEVEGVDCFGPSREHYQGFQIDKDIVESFINAFWRRMEG